MEVLVSALRSLFYPGEIDPYSFPTGVSQSMIAEVMFEFSMTCPPPTFFKISNPS